MKRHHFALYGAECIFLSDAVREVNHTSEAITYIVFTKTPK